MSFEILAASTAVPGMLGTAYALKTGYSWLLPGSRIQHLTTDLTQIAKDGQCSRAQGREAELTHLSAKIGDGLADEIEHRKHSQRHLHQSFGIRLEPKVG